MAAETCAPTIGQGVYGQVLWREGNHAPGTGDAGGDADAWFCNAFDKHGAWVVEVLATSLTRFDIVIDYAAAY